MKVNQKAWRKIHQRLLDEGKAKSWYARCASIDTANSEVAEICIAADYFEKNAERMRIPSFAASICLSVQGDRAGCQNP